MAYDERSLQIILKTADSTRYLVTLQRLPSSPLLKSFKSIQSSDKQTMALGRLLWGVFDVNCRNQGR